MIFQKIVEAKGHSSQPVMLDLFLHAGQCIRCMWSLWEPSLNLWVELDGRTDSSLVSSKDVEKGLWKHSAVRFSRSVLSQNLVQRRGRRQNGTGLSHHLHQDKQGRRAIAST